MQDIVIFGASSHAKVVIDIIEKQNKFNIIGLIDNFQKKGTIVYDYKVLGNEQELFTNAKYTDIYGGIVAIGDNWVRGKVASKILSAIPSFRFITAIHPTATIARGAQIGDGTVLMAGVNVGSDARVGKHCIINTKASIEHESKIGNFVHIIAGVITGGKVSVGDYSSIALGATLIAGVNVGKHTVVGAGSVVFGDIGDQVVAYGTPAKIIRTREVDEQYLVKKNKF